ncbi:thermopsin family protease [Thermoplasmatales archaeon AK]|nr:thermopsin family protease [Thermoplasmatales archaeon AK]
MQLYKKLRWYLAVLVVVALIMSMVFAIGPTKPNSIHNNTAYSNTASTKPLGQPASSYGSSQIGFLKDHRNLSRYVFLPTMNRQPLSKSGTVQPLYVVTPAPMGIGDMGLMLKNGKVVGTLLETPSFEAAVNITNMTAFYTGNDAPYSVTFQLNTVTYHTTLFGKSLYEFWTQNVVFYSTRTHQLQFVDNIWNFSSPTAFMTSNAIYNSTGTVIPFPGVHIAIGPTFTINYPFSVFLYNNLTVINGRDTVFFNYSIPKLGVNGTYDRVEFNSTFGMPLHYSAPPTLYRVDGNEFAPNGLLYDAEIMVGGPGGGSTSTIYSINATMELKYLQVMNQPPTPSLPPPPPAPPSPPSPPGGGPGQNPFEANTMMAQGKGNLPGPGPNPPQPPSPPHPPPGPMVTSRYVNVPSAYDIGTDTGETSEGVSVSWGGATAHLSAGPSLIYGMWNLSASDKMMTFSGKVSPSNAFFFVSPGLVSAPSDSAFVPLSLSGTYDFELPEGVYSAAFLMSDYNPSYSVLSPNMNTTLTRNTDDGIYTPLLAYDNGQLANISQGGNGSSTNPFIAYNKSFVNILSYFGEINDFTFPVFEGVMIKNTNLHIDFQGMPEFQIQYTGFYAFELSFFGFPITNYLGYWLYNVSNASITDTSLITGWYSSFVSGFPLANVLLWNTTHVLVGGNNFQTLDSSILVFGGSDNVIWGNSIQNASPVLLESLGLNESTLANVQIFGEPLGLSVYSSGNLIYNNIFNSTLTAVSPSFSIYTGLPAEYLNQWNVSLRPSSAYTVFNGYNLTGTILPSLYQGGNYWWNFRGIIPYNNSGGIEFGGDYEPLNLLIIEYGPVIPVPLNSIVVVPVYAAFVSHSTISTIVNNSVFFPYGSYSKITVSFFDQYLTNPFDDSFLVQVNNTEILAGNTLELENTSVTENVTQYYSILQGPASVLVTSPQFNPGYTSRLSTWFTFYIGPEAPHPQMVLSAYSDIAFPTPSNAFPNNVPIPFNVTKTFNVTFPSDVTGAYMNFYEQQNGNDEFWYTLQPPFREFRIYIGNELVATVEPYPNIQTGGGDLFLWQPILAIGAELYPPHMINLDPYLALLHGTQQIKVEVVFDENLWIRSGLNFMLNTSSTPVLTYLLSNSYTFMNSYVQVPPTNQTTESIPYSAVFLNDSEMVNEELQSAGLTISGSEIMVSDSVKTVTFEANATEFDPSLDIAVPTSTGYEVPSYENFSLKETLIAETYTNITLINSSTNVAYGYLDIVSVKSAYYQINGTSTIDLYLNSSGSLTSIGIGFNVTQIRNITELTLVSWSINGSSGSQNITTINDTTVVGHGFFVGVINSESELTSISYNHAETIKTVNSETLENGIVIHFYKLYEMAINDSLVLRNGELVQYTVISGS